MAMAAMGVTNPAAGVMATRPTTAAIDEPVALGLSRRTISVRTHVTTAAAPASMVVTRARAARPLAASADPALKPNQPNHRSDAPSTTSGTLCGASVAPPGWLRRRGPRNAAATRAETPALTWTT